MRNYLIKDTLFGYSLINDCTMAWFAVQRSYDRTHSIATSLYVASIIVEDFALLISSTVRLNSVLPQMLIYVYAPLAGACSIQSNITGDGACIG